MRVSFMYHAPAGHTFSAETFDASEPTPLLTNRGAVNRVVGRVISTTVINEGRALAITMEIESGDVTNSVTGNVSGTFVQAGNIDSGGVHF